MIKEEKKKPEPPKPEPKKPEPPKPEPKKPEPPKPEAKPQPKFDFSKELANETSQLKSVGQDRLPMRSRWLTQRRRKRSSGLRRTSVARPITPTRFAARFAAISCLPPSIQGNPEAVFMVEQLPTGEVLSVKLKRSSGNGVLDRAIETAILKSSPLPKPDDPSLFERSLEIKYRPFEE